MLQINNLEESKSEWNFNETHIIIPMIDKDKNTEKFTKNSITLNNLDGGDHSTFEHSFVIGLDRNLFETHNNKSDLLVIQNSDLKLLNNSDTKSSIAYALSYIDHDRNDILWENSVHKDKVKSTWCSSEKPIFEEKNVLNYINSAQDVSKIWNDDLEKNEEISLEIVNPHLTSQDSKIGQEILIPIECRSNENKNVANDVVDGSHLIVNYYPSLQSCESIPMLSSSIISEQKEVENFTECNATITDNQNEIQSDLLQRSNTEVTTSTVICEDNYKTLIERDGSIVNLINDQAKDKIEKSELDSECASSFKGFDCKKIDNVKQLLKDGKTRKYMKPETNENGSSLPEKSLPLKKKAKMKRTIVTDALKLHFQSEVSSAGSHTNGLHRVTDIVEFDNKMEFVKEKDSNKISKVKKIKKNIAVTNNINKLEKEKKKNTKNISTCVTSNEKPNLNLTKCSEQAVNFQSETTQSSGSEPSNLTTLNSFKNIFHLIENLKTSKLISESVWKILQLGLEEMNVDILEEMSTKCSRSSLIDDHNSYSVQLKAFALILYFKQPAAFNHLSKLYGSGWPSLSVIKNWKRKVNSYQRPNFVRMQKSVSET